MDFMKKIAFKKLKNKKKKDYRWMVALRNAQKKGAIK
jgi:hypothetical protein